jgi:hypothetical protein
MRAHIVNFYGWVKEKIVWFFLICALTWVTLALCFQVYMVYLEFSGRDETIKQIITWFDVTFDGRWAHDPRNIFYEEPKKIDVSSVTNKVVVGSLAGNRNLEFGVKSVIEEALQDKEYELDPNASLKITAEIVYLDVLKTQTSLSVLHKNKESVVIRLKGQLIENGKVKKKAIVEESADEVSMSTIVIDQGGKFNQQNLSSALKKTSVSLVNKLLD